MLVEKIVFVFDICSSTIMMEDAQMTSSLDCYANLAKDFEVFLGKVKKQYSFEEYKFLGDGYILLFNKEVSFEKIYQFAEELVDIGGKLVSMYIEEHMQNKNLPRVGITIGVDSGVIYKFDGEYIGRAINIACRLQGKLDLTESVNRIIISQKVYRTIKDASLKKKFEYKPKTLRNVNAGKEVPCYESSPLIFEDSIRRTGINDQDKYEYIPSGPSVIERSKINDQVISITIRRSDGTIVYNSEKPNEMK